MRVTIFSDASLSYQTQMAGWGGYAVSNRGKWSSGGPLRGTYDCVFEAEFAALVNTLHHSIYSEVAKKGDSILAQTDNMELVMFFEHPLEARKLDPKRVRSLRARSLTEHTQMMLAENELRLTLQHVKGHNNDGKARSWVNQQCDKLAKQGRREAEHLQKKEAVG